MGFALEIIYPNEDNKCETIIHSNESDFQTDVFQYLVKQPFFKFSKVAEIKETVEKLEFENNKEYTLYGFVFSVKWV